MDNEEEYCDVVISGISGKFPQCENLEELKHKLLEKENLISKENCKWNPGELNVPSAIGQISVTKKFDDTFFGIHSGITAMMDPLTRVAIERAYEAIMDAGINPINLRNSNTAVYTNSCISDSESVGCDEKLTAKFWLLAHVRALLANRISYVLNLKGPSWTIDSNWTGGIQCLKQAVFDVRSGRVEGALVGVSNVLVFPDLSQHWLGLGKLSPDGTCQPFQEDANGYARSEAVVFLYLQKANVANRIYASVSHIDAEFLGDKANTFLQPKKEAFEEFCRKFYSDSKIHPSDVAYLEADGSGGKYNDELELNSLSEVLCNERKDKLLVGTVKKNLGHCEGASSLVSVAKALICLDSGIIAPNLDFQNPNKNIEKLVTEDIKIVTEPVPLPNGKFVAINSIGLTSSVGHVLLKPNLKEKKLALENHRQIPRLVIISARHEAGILNIINKLESMPYDVEYFSLINNVFKDNISGHFYRGFTILGATEKKIHFTLESGSITNNKRPIWFVFAGMGSQWPGMGADLMNLPVFAKTMAELDTYLKPLGIDIVKVITSFDPTILQNIVNSFVGIAAIQIGMVDVLKSVGIEPDGMFGHSLGENACAYADGCFTKYQTIMGAYFRGKASSEVQMKKGLMAAIGLGHDQLNNLPENVQIACHNSSDNTTISGPFEEVQAYMEEMKRQNRFARAVNSNFIAYHSRQVQPLAPFVLENLSKVVPHPKKRSYRWISTSVPAKDWNSPAASVSSAEYHVNNFLSRVYFQEACAYVPEEAIVIEISPHGLFQSILKRSVPESCFCIPLGKREISSPLNFLLSSIGKLFVVGLQPDVNALYAPVEYPVSKGTPSLATLATWNHETDWELTNYKDKPVRRLEISLRDRKWRFLKDYKIHDKMFVPFPLLLLETLNAYETNDSILIFEKVNIPNFIEVTCNSVTSVHILVQYGSGNFEIMKENQMIMSGVIRYSQENILPEEIYSENELNDCISFSQNEIQDVFRQHAMEFSTELNRINEIVITEEGCQATLIWDNNLAFFINAMAHVKLFYDLCTTEKSPIFPMSFLRLAIELEKYNTMQSGNMVNITYNKDGNIIKGPGIELLGFQTTYKPMLSKNNPLIFQDLQFVSHERPQIKNLENFYNLCGQIIGETYFTEIDHEKHEKLSPINVILIDDIDKEQFQIKQFLEVLYRELPQTPIDVTIWNTNASKNGEKNGNKSYKYLILCKNTKNIVDALSHMVDYAEDVFVLCFDKSAKIPKQYTNVTKENFSSFDAILWKKKMSVNENIIKINPFGDDGHWLEDLEEDLYGINVQKSVIIQWESDQIIDVVDVINQITAVGSNHSIRYLVTMDNNVPAYNKDSEFYKKQLEQGLVMNIFKNGEWGSIRHLSVANDLLSQSDIQHFAFKTKKIENINVEYLSIHKSFRKAPSLFNASCFEFSGTIHKERVMGIAGFNGHDSVQTKPLFKWTVPEQWSLEDAVTVPLAYVKAYYALVVKGKLSSGASILVHSGHTLIGEAAIAVALSLNCKIYTTTNTAKQAKYLTERFPNSDNLQIISTENQNFDIEIRKLTKGKGVDLILNLETKKQFDQIDYCLKYYGAVVQVSENTFESDYNIGLEMFLKSATFYSITNLSILKKQPEIINQIQHLVQDALKCGIISRPFERIVYKSKDESQINRSLKENNNSLSLVIKQEVEESSLKETFICDPKKCYLIIGNKTEIWFNIIVWLLEHNAQKIVFIEEQSNDTDYNQYQKRFNIFIQDYPNLSIMHLPASSIQSKDEMIDAVNTINNVGVLDAVFCLSLDSVQMNIINFGLLKHGSRLRQLICLQCDGSKVCESRHQLSLPALNLIWDRSITNTALLITNIKQILNNSLKINSPLIYIANSTQYIPKFDNHKFNQVKEFLPSFHEAEFFIDGFSTTPIFEKVTSKCSYYDTKTQLFPVFIIPGLYSKRLQPLIKNLMYPVFCAKISHKYSSARNTAQSLMKSLKEIQPKGPYTIVGESWSGAIALELASLLEQNLDDRVQLILLEGIPKDMQEKLTSIGVFGSTDFLDSVCELCFGKKMSKEIKLEDGKVKIDSEQIKFLELVQKKLTSIHHYTPTNLNFNNKVIALKSFDADILSTYIDFEEQYGRDLDLKILEGNYNDLIKSNITANIINDNVLFKW